MTKILGEIDMLPIFKFDSHLEKIKLHGQRIECTMMTTVASFQKLTLSLQLFFPHFSQMGKVILQLTLDFSKSCGSKG